MMYTYVSNTLGGWGRGAREGEARGEERQRREKESEEKGALHPGVCQAG